MATKKTEAIEPKPVETKKDDNRVTIMIPYVEGEDKEVTVWVNDKATKIKKGYQVEVTRDVAEVLQNANQQMMVAMENREKLREQHQDW